jgi:hypothetical protein
METAIVILKNGESYETPASNLENVRRVLAGKYHRIIMPGDEDEIEEVEEVVEKKKGKKKK